MRFKFNLLLILMSIVATSFSQEVGVKGKITDNEGNPLVGASVVVKGTAKGTIADIDGNYTLSFSGDATSVLVFSFIGYENQEIAVNNQSEINVVMISDIADIDEVVVVGYGTQKKSVVTGSIARVDKEIIEKSRSSRIESALQGQTAGVVIMNNSGQPGDNMTIRIRGVGTVKDADPLYIVDGLPLEKESLDFLNPSDVESVEVLKDASATAIYGTRGANGVVLITTKSGRKNEKIQVSYSAYYGIQNPWRKLDMLNAQEYMEFINSGKEIEGRDPIFDENFVPDLGDDRITELKWDTDWQEQMFYKNAPKQSHTISLNGGTENVTYATSVSYMNQDGIVAKGKSNFERIAIRSNNTYKLGFIELGSNINLVNINKKGVDPNDQYSSYSLIQAMNTPPIVPVKFDNGDWATPSDFGMALQEVTNSVAMLSFLNRKETINKLVGGLHAEVEIVKGLKFKTHYSTEMSYVTNDNFTPEYYLDPTHPVSVPQSVVTKEITRYNRWNLDNTLRYTNTINDHSFTALAGLTYFKNWNENLGASMADLIFEDFERAYLDNGTSTYLDPYGGYNENRLASVFGRINYNYQEKYLFEGVVRRDGSSKFGSDYRYGIFPAFSAGWVASRENFFPAQNIINFAKLRLSWGQNGNDQIAAFQYSPTMTNGDIYFFGENQDMHYGIRPERIPNSEVRWETSEQLTLGANLGFFENRITLNLDYYDKRTKDWLLEPPTMIMLGNEPSDENMGEVANKGLEIELGYKNKFGDLNFSASFIATMNKSEVISIENNNGYFTGGSIHSQGNLLRVEPGKPLGYFWGHEIKGVFQTDEEARAYTHPETGEEIQKGATAGDFIYNDRDGDGRITDEDRTMIGSPYPKFNGGLNLSADWKGFDVYMFWYTALGHDIYMGIRRYDLQTVNYSQEDYDNRWTGPGSTNEYPRFTLTDRNKNYKTPSEFFVRDADYLRLKNLTLGYTLPKSITQMAQIEKVRFYVTAENLLTFTKYTGMEPEVGGEPLSLGIDKGIYPQAKSFVFGVSVNF